MPETLKSVDVSEADDSSDLEVGQHEYHYTKSSSMILETI